MGCNCGKKPKVINNTKNQQILNEVKAAFDGIMLNKTIEELDDFDKLELVSLWRLLYPAAQGTPDIPKVIHDIETSMQFLKVKYK